MVVSPKLFVVFELETRRHRHGIQPVQQRASAFVHDKGVQSICVLDIIVGAVEVRVCIALSYCTTVVMII